MSFTPEHEVRILNINVDEVVKNILALGGTCIFSGIQVRSLYDVPSNVGDSAWLRLRSSEQGTTLTLKRYNGPQAEELEVTVGDYQKMAGIFKLLGLEPRAVHENFRALYHLSNDVVLSIDIWPGLQPFLEIEGPDMATVLEAVGMLGFTPEDTNQLTIPQLYESYGTHKITHANLKFLPGELDAYEALR